MPPDPPRPGETWQDVACRLALSLADQRETTRCAQAHARQMRAEAEHAARSALIAAASCAGMIVAFVILLIRCAV